MALQLEVGKFYRTRDGDRVEIVRRDDHTTWPFNSSEGNSYQGDGFFYRCDRPNDLDLIAEWHDTTDLTAITTPFGLLDKSTQEALRAHGGPYEVFHKPGWFEDTSRPDDWPEWAYRVRPAPKVETVKMDTSIDDAGRVWGQSGSRPVRVTFTRTNGVIDLDSYKVEAR